MPYLNGCALWRLRYSVIADCFPFILSIAMEKLSVLAQPGGPTTSSGIFISNIIKFITQ